MLIPRTNLKKLPKQIFNPRSSNSMIEEQRDLIREFLKINKMKLKTFIELYGPDLLNNISPLNEGNGLKKMHIDTIPSVIKDLEEIMTLHSQGSKSIISAHDIKNQDLKDTSSYQHLDQSNINSEKKLIEGNNEELKECSSGNKIPKQKEMIFSNNKLSNHRFRKSQSPHESVVDKNRDLTYSPISQLEEVNRDQNYTETTQQHNTFVKQIIKEAGIDISDDGIKNQEIVQIQKEVFNPENQEKPSFFETCVDIPPYLQNKNNNLRNTNIMHNIIREERFLNHEDSNGNTIKDELEPYLKIDKESSFIDKSKTLLKNRRRVQSKGHPHKIIGRGNYKGYKDFMTEYFQNRELEAMNYFNRIDRIKFSRKFYKGNTTSS